MGSRKRALYHRGLGAKHCSAFNGSQPPCAEARRTAQPECGRLIYTPPVGSLMVRLPE